MGSIPSPDSDVELTLMESRSLGSSCLIFALSRDSSRCVHARSSRCCNPCLLPMPFCSLAVMSDSVTPWTAALQASLTVTISQSLLKLTSVDLVMPSNHLILCCPLLLLPSVFPVSGSFLMSWLFASHGQSTGASASASVLPVNIQS